MLEYKRAVPFTMFTGGVGRHAQGKLPIAKDYMGDPSAKTVRFSAYRRDEKEEGLSACGFVALIDLWALKDTRLYSQGVDRQK